MACTSIPVVQSTRDCLQLWRTNWVLTHQNNVEVKEQRLWMHPGSSSAFLTMGSDDRYVSGSCPLAPAAVAEIERQELLWQEFFLDPTQWWDNRTDKRSQRHPDFRHKSSKEPLWLNSFHKPGWVDSQLVRWDSKLRDKFQVDGIGLSPEEGELRADVEALELLVLRGCHVSESLFYLVLRRCEAQKDMVSARRVHALAIRSGHESNLFLANYLLGLYASHRMLEEARNVFTKVATPSTYMWSSIILAHARQGYSMEAVALYRQMQESCVKPDNHVFAAALNACASAEDLMSGKEVHAGIVASGVQPDIFVSNSLVNMYAKCGSLEAARRVFDELPTRDVVTWTSMIGGYAQQGRCQEALDLYASMQVEGKDMANRVTFVCLVQACAGVGALHQGKQLHVQIEERGLETDVLVGNCLVDMYAKCGSLEDARRLFDRLPMKDEVTWGALLNGYAEHGDGSKAIEFFREMREQAVEPDAAVFLCLLVACSHAGLVSDGQQYFKMMAEDYGIEPTDYHYSCLVDLLARSGYLDEAERSLQAMPVKSAAVAWKTLLSACKNHGDVERGKRCFNQLMQLEPENASAYVLLGNIYANAGRWDEVDVIESLRKSAGAWKKPAKACIEVRNKVHEFMVGEERSDLLTKMMSVSSRLKEEGGHVPQTAMVLSEMSEEEKEAALCGHAEKLALAYGLLNTPDGTSLLVTKNLRMCNDCHSGTKIMSRVEKREIIVRDAHRVHRFLDGSCSCGDRH